MDQEKNVYIVNQETGEVDSVMSMDEFMRERLERHMQTPKYLVVETTGEEIE